MPKVAEERILPNIPKRRARTGGARIGQSRVETVMKAAEQSGLLTERSGRIAGRVSPALIKRAKDRTGITSDSDLIVYALANVALEDNFAEEFKAARGTVDPALKLGF
jgi:hypothetical protein